MTRPNEQEITPDSRFESATGISIQIMAQQGTKFAAMLYKKDKQIGGIGNDENGLYIRLRKQPTVRDMTDLMLFAEKLNTEFAQQPFTFSLIPEDK